MRIIGLLFLVTSLNAQEYELTMYFSNNQGDSDSIVIGYDENATYDIESNFGEKNILGNGYLDDLEVRASIYEYQDIRHRDTRIIESKRMIIGKVCEDSTYFDEANAIMIVIKNVSWPLLVSWDNEVINTNCKRTQLVNCTPGGWFDVCGGRGGNIQAWMRDTNRMEYTDTDYRIIESNGDTLNAIFVSFISRIGSSVTDRGQYAVNKVFPNPTTRIFMFEEKFKKGTVVELYDSHGKLIYIRGANEEHDIEKYGEGVYFYCVKEGAQVVKTGRIVKLNSSL